MGENLGGKISTGRSPEQIRQETLQTIDRTESLFAEREAALQAFLPEEGRFERLRREAEGLAQRWGSPDAPAALPLAGWLIGVKDCLHVDGFLTRVGSRLPAEELQGPEASAVTRLKNAGALILGKTVTTEFTYFAPGPTTNPHHPEHTPGGSSSGSAAAVGAGLCPLALGTQTIGSIGRPAAFCGAVGFKASYGRIPADGAVYLASSLDHVGFFTVNAADAVAAATVLVDGWRGCQTLERPLMFGVPTGPYLDSADEDGLAHFFKTCDALRNAGHGLREVDAFADFDEIRERHQVLVAGEAARHHAERFDPHEALYRQKTAALIRRGREIHDDALATARDGRLTLRQQLEDAMNKNELDFWISPPARGAAPHGLDATGDPVMNLPWTQSGLPTAVLRAGRNAAGLPLGLQVAGRFGADEDVLAAALNLENAALSESAGEAP